MDRITPEQAGLLLLDVAGRDPDRLKLAIRRMIDRLDRGEELRAMSNAHASGSSTSSANTRASDRNSFRPGGV